MPAHLTCPHCGARLPADSPHGLCPKCLLLGQFGPTDPPPESAPASPASIGIPAPPLTLEKPGDRIGRYKLLQTLGEGGCGIVYMAEQDEPVKRRVALKIIKLGMDTKEVIARFEAERQALALMDHPNIAKVLDGGATSTGRPFFVMELVRGIPITRYCDEHRLVTRQRIELFITVCQAIQHAHQKGIIHRDIKPSNILVADHDGVGVPKVIDFGIAKATAGQTLTDKTLFTAFEQFIGTPAYMSPEQAKLSGLDIDTRSDIYSLGVLLYELLTGKTPFEAKRLIQAGLDEIRRIIQEEDPPKPSTRLSTLDAAEQTKVAHQRQSEPPKLAGLVRGDLDWIVMKTLEKDRARRYETANGVAMDLRRFLGNEPVLACPPSNLYRFQKLVRRHKVAFIGTAAVVLALVLGLGLSTWLFVKERAARHQAKEQAERADKLVVAEASARRMAQEKEKQALQSAADANAVLAFVCTKVLATARPPGEPGGISKDVTVREALEAAEKSIPAAFSNQPTVEASVRGALGETEIYLGNWSNAVPQLERAVELFRANLGPDGEDTLRAMNNLALAYDGVGRQAEATKMLEQVSKGLESTRGADDQETLISMHNLAWQYFEQDRLDEAIALSEKTLMLRKAKLGPDHNHTLSSMELLGLSFRQAGRLTEATALLEESLRRGRSQSDSLTLLSTMGNLAFAYQAEGRFAEALTLREEVLKQRKEQYGPEAPQTLISMNNLALLYQAMNRPEALSLFEETYRLRLKKQGPEHQDTLVTMDNLVSAYLAAGRAGDAEPLARACLDIREKRSPDQWRTFNTRGLLGAVLLAREQYTDSERLLLSACHELQGQADRLPAEGKTRLKHTIEALVKLYEATGRSDQATQWK